MFSGRQENNWITPLTASTVEAGTSENFTKIDRSFVARKRDFDDIDGRDVQLSNEWLLLLSYKSNLCLANLNDFLTLAQTVLDTAIQKCVLNKRQLLRHYTNNEAGANQYL